MVDGGNIRQFNSDVEKRYRRFQLSDPPINLTEQASSETIEETRRATDFASPSRSMRQVGTSGRNEESMSANTANGTTIPSLPLPVGADRSRLTRSFESSHTLAPRNGVLGFGLRFRARTIAPETNEGSQPRWCRDKWSVFRRSSARDPVPIVNRTGRRTTRSLAAFDRSLRRSFRHQGTKGLFALQSEITTPGGSSNLLSGSSRSIPVHFLGTVRSAGYLGWHRLTPRRRISLTYLLNGRTLPRPDAHGRTPDEWIAYRQ